MLIRFFYDQGGIAMPRDNSENNPFLRVFNEYNVLRIPVQEPLSVKVRWNRLDERYKYGSGGSKSYKSYASYEMKKSVNLENWYELNLAELGLADGAYEYEFVVERDNPIWHESTDGSDPPEQWNGKRENGKWIDIVPDPFATEITRFAGYRGIFRMAGGKRKWNQSNQDRKWEPADHGVEWEGEDLSRLRNDNELVLYELPMHWVAAGSEPVRQVSLGTFEDALFNTDLLDQWRDLGINAIELLPIQDSTDTLNWGYGTRFFFTTDWAMGKPLDLKLFIKCCHNYGIRVILDVVMNHSRCCPLEKLAPAWVYLKASEEPDRAGWGGRRFRYDNAYDYPFCRADDFFYAMAKFWICEYHVDGFRIDEFKGIDNWDFIREFRRTSHACNNAKFGSRPFIVIAEDSGRDRRILSNESDYVVDSMWNFDYVDDMRLLLKNNLPANDNGVLRADRIKTLIDPMIELKRTNGSSARMRVEDMARMVNYFTSHDVQDRPRLMNLFMETLLEERGLNNCLAGIGQLLLTEEPENIKGCFKDAIERVFGAFALTLTSVGIPMFLAGEEFADVHDLDFRNWQFKMSDPVNWERRNQESRQALMERIKLLIRLRTQETVLHQNDTNFFHFNLEDKSRTFAYCRTGAYNEGNLGRPGQILVFANTASDDNAINMIYYPWWNALENRLFEIAPSPTATPITFGQAPAVPLAPFQVRVFRIEP